MIAIEIADQQNFLTVDHNRLRRVMEEITSDAGFTKGQISLAIVDNATIHPLNREHLQHDYPTDVLSFVFDQTDDFLEGEVIVSAEMALERASEFALTPDDELLLYVIHGVLHLVGYDDKHAAAKQIMRAKERYYLQQCGVSLPASVIELGQESTKE